MKKDNQAKDKKRQKLSTLWLLVALNMILADVLSIFVALVNDDALNIPGDVKVMMLVGAVIVNIPIMMIYLSKYLSSERLKIITTIAASFTILAIIGGGSLTPHYIFIGAIEVLILLKIIFDVRSDNTDN